MASIPEFFIFFLTKSSAMLSEGKEISILANSESGLECVEVPEMVQKYERWRLVASRGGYSPAVRLFLVSQSS